MRPNERMVTLADGREVSNYSQEWRHECELRTFLATQPTRSMKHLYLYGVPDRGRLFKLSHKTGQPELVDDYKSLWVVRSPMMKFRGLEATDQFLADAKRLYDLMNSQPTEKAS